MNSKLSLESIVMYDIKYKYININIYIIIMDDNIEEFMK